TYVDETEEITRHCEGGEDYMSEQPSPPSSGYRTAEDSSVSGGVPRHTRCPSFVSSQQHRTRSSPSLHIEASETGPIIPRASLNSQEWPLRNPNEAILFRHYVQNLATWLDACDPLRHFQTLVPRKARTCPILLNAIFAAASRHLSNTSEYDDLASNRYHEQCLKFLIPTLNHATVVSDEDMFAATIILRLLEEIEVKHTGMDSHGYLLGIHAFVNGGEHPLQTGGLVSAAFWVGLRQEIYIASMDHQPVKINLPHGMVDRSLEPADDSTWSNRAVVHIADVLNFCFGNDKSFSWWTELREWCTRWQESLPPTFTPIYEKKESEYQPFPEIWYDNACSVIGIQHHILANMFLTRFDPQIPQIGGQRKASVTKMTLAVCIGQRLKPTKQEIMRLVRRICGIGLCNQWTPPAMFTACMAIAAFGDLFQDQKDQEALLDILQRTERNHSRPTEATQQQMIKSWGWISEE
ncbi:hypothetical protein MKZ38_001003, partial [Zalerion maritima]